MTDTPNSLHYLDDCPCGENHRANMLREQKLGRIYQDGTGVVVTITPRRTQGQTSVLPEVDVFKALENVLLRPAMFFGRKSITAFWHYYHGMIHLADDRTGYHLFTVKNCLRDGFQKWVCEKRGWARNVDLAFLYLTLAKQQCRLRDIEEPSQVMQEALGFDFFARDLGEFRGLSPCASNCRVGYTHDGDCIPMEGR